MDKPFSHVISISSFICYDRSGSFHYFCYIPYSRLRHKVPGQIHHLRITGGLSALETPEWRIFSLKMVGKHSASSSYLSVKVGIHWTCRVEQWPFLSFLFPLAEAYFTITQSKSFGKSEAYIWGLCTVSRGWIKDTWVFLHWSWHCDKAKLAFCIIPAAVFLLENIWTRHMVPRTVESAASQRRWVFIIVIFILLFIYSACYGRFFFSDPWATFRVCPSFELFLARNKFKFLHWLLSSWTSSWNQHQSTVRYKVETPKCALTSILSMSCHI